MPGDLHIHTQLSDGSMGINDVIVLAKKRGISTIAVTDQDMLYGCERAKIIGDRYEVNVLEAVELSSTNPHNGKEVHILCYLPESTDRLQGLCRENLQKRAATSQRMLVQIMRRYPITPELVKNVHQGSTCVYPIHLMRALLESGCTDRMFGDLWEELFTEHSERNILFKTHFRPPQEVIETVHNAKGLAVLAHPGLDGAGDMLEELIAAGLDGIEVFHAANSREEQKRLAAICKVKNLAVVGGSDFRGMYSPGAVTIGDQQMNDSQVSQLLSFKARRRRRASHLALTEEAEAEA
ncbi:MAG: PHP domain-containing protein [Oscillospiraceae bacterium]|jgi:predicted metal-dependent phosphoesterase TrpH|nr:PHP domain-containing protein [Oscillospiraceae bacterium]